MDKKEKTVTVHEIGNCTGANGGRFKFLVSLYAGHKEDYDEFLKTSTSHIVTIHGKEVHVVESFDELDKLMQEAGAY